MSTPLRVLIVEDSEEDALLLIRELTTNRSTNASRRPRLWQLRYGSRPGDIIISDYVMPQFSGPGALKLVQEQGFDQPFIMVSGKTGEEIAVAAMKAGAHDYIMKDTLTRLVPAVERGERNVTLKNLLIIADGLKMPLSTLIAAAEAEVMISSS